MLIKGKQLKDTILQIAREQYGAARFRRRDLLRAVEKELRQRGVWTTEDDEPSSSSDPKSQGLANIDYRFSDLAREGHLVRSERNSWQISQSLLQAANVVARLPTNRVTLLVEGQHDIAIVRPILQAAGLPVDRMSFQAIGGKSKIARTARDIPDERSSQYAALIDADQQNVPDAKELARQQLGYPPFPVFCAVPQIEAWLFADDEAAERYARGESVKEVLKRLPPPELIPYPKQVAANVFGHGKSNIQSFGFLQEINIERAAARSPSLRDFLIGISDLLHEPISFNSADVTDEASRDIFIGLINEVSKSDSVLWRTVDGTELTASDLRDEIQRGTPLGRQYISEVLRVARDMIARQSRRH